MFASRQACILTDPRRVGLQQTGGVMSAEHTDTQTETRAQWKRWRAQSNTVDEGLIGEGS